MFLVLIVLFQHPLFLIPSSCRNRQKKKRNPRQHQMLWRAGFRRKTMSPRLAMSAFRLTSETKCWNQAAMSFAFDGSGASSVPPKSAILGLPTWMDCLHHGDCRLKLTALHAHFSPKGAMPDLISQDTHLHHPAAISTSSVAIPLACSGSGFIALFQVYMTSHLFLVPTSPCVRVSPSAPRHPRQKILSTFP